MKQHRITVGSVFSILAFAVFIISFTLPVVSVGSVGGASIYYYIAQIDALTENKETFWAIILFIAAAGLMLFCIITAILFLCKGEGNRSVFFTRVMAFFAFALCVTSVVLFAIKNENIVGTGTIVPMVSSFLCFVGNLILPSEKVN